MKFLLCCGAEKAGTTWLHNYFRTHPEYHDIGKELNIIQRDSLVPCFSDVTKYRSNLDFLFKQVSELDKVTGDFTHYEGSSENIFRLLKDGFARYNIEVVPVYIMRDPIDRAWSSWNMLGGGDLDMPEPARFLVNNYLECKYKDTVLALDKVFEKPLYYFYETFFEQKNIIEICQRLNLSYIPADFTSKINVGTYPTVSQEFINKFCKSKKTTECIEFLTGKFGNVPFKNYI